MTLEYAIKRAALPENIDDVEKLDQLIVNELNRHALENWRLHESGFGVTPKGVHFLLVREKIHANS